MPNSALTIQYIYHSGFILKTEDKQLIFDYFKGTVNLEDKPTYVFSSHIHADHYNPEIFKWAKEQGNIQYILSNDIEGEKNLPSEKGHITFMSPYEEIQLDGLRIKAYGSTDEGGSFLVHCDGLKIFHAGDLNWWHWWGEPQADREHAEKLFKSELAKIKGESIDIAFFPVDPRLEQYYSIGAEAFIQEIKPQILIPMHFGEDYAAIKTFAEKMRGNPTTRILEIMQRGQEFTDF